LPVGRGAGRIGRVEPLSENRIRDSFVNCSKGEAKRLSLPGRLVDLNWLDLDFLGWRDPKAGNNAYVVVPRAGGPVGVALKIASQLGGRIKGSMCTWCCTTHGTGDVALFSARRVGSAGKLGNTVGTYVCANLACPLYVKGTLRAAVIQPGERLTVERRVERMMANLHGFVDEVLTDGSRRAAAG
jgi:hypothetical protein